MVEYSLPYASKPGEEEAQGIIKHLSRFAYPGTPSLECDLVLGGGVMSGVAYPFAACELAKCYRFRRLSGTSVGATAAATVAAAELGRRTGGFRLLATLPTEVASRLPSVFQPAGSTKALFDVFLSTVRNCHRSRAMLALAFGRALCKARPLSFGFGAMMPVLLLPVGTLNVSTSMSPLDLLRIVMLAGTVGILTSVGSLALLACRALPRVGYGLCPGSAGTAVASGGALKERPDCEPVTDWLAHTLDQLAGLDEADGPLTFGQLWGWNDPSNVDYSQREWQDDIENCGGRKVDLQMTATNLTSGRSVRLPSETRNYLFCPHEMAPLFPPYVIEQLLSGGNSSPRSAKVWCCPDHKDPLVPLPPPPDIPVIFAVRLSMSFPILLAAVPLFAISDGCHGDIGPSRCWLSDGGIRNNFPIDLLDGPGSERPIFGLLLKNRGDCGSWRFGVCASAERLLPRTMSNRGSLFSFVLRVISVFLNSRVDGTLMSRSHAVNVAEIPVEKGEGSLNIGMGAHGLMRLAARGWHAGQALRLAARSAAVADKRNWDSGSEIAVSDRGLCG